MKSESLPDGGQGYGLLDLPPYFDQACGDDLIWLDSCGIGICRRRPGAALYTRPYFEEFKQRDQTEMGQKLTAARISFVLDYNAGADVVDIGIGGGRFVREMDCFGYDINPEAIDWLKQHDRWHDARIGEAQAFTFFDSLEHALDWGAVLKNCRQWAFISTPIYRDRYHCLNSRHFKPGEHALYFTERGLRNFMNWHSFEIEGRSDVESLLGRDGICSYAFRRRR